MTTDFESQLRTQLADAAERAPVFTGVDSERAVTQTSAPTDASRHRRRRRWLALAAAAAAVAAVAAAGVSWWPVGSGGGDGAAVCASELVLDGNVYQEDGELVRVPRHGPSLGKAVRPACGDGEGMSVAEQVEAFELPGVSPDIAFFANGGVWLSGGLQDWPAWAEELSKPVPCTGAGETTIGGTVIGINAPQVEKAYDFRIPYTANFLADEGSTLPLTEYTSVTIRMRVTAATTGGRDDEFLRLALSDAARVTATVRCDGAHFEATSLKLAP